MRESTRARRLSIRVHPHGAVEVVVPRRTRPEDVREFVTQNRAWVNRTLTRLGLPDGPQAAVRPLSLELASTNERWHVDYRHGEGTRSRFDVHRTDSSPRLSLTLGTGNDDAWRQLLRRWLVDYAREVFEPRLHSLSEATGLPYSRLQVRRQRTRWGSCSVRGTISINCGLLFLSPALGRYLLVHELCHTRHMNHSPAFWRLVLRHEPDARALDRALTQAWASIPPWVYLDV